MTLLLLAVTLLCSHAYAQNRGSELMKQAETSLSQNEYVKARYLFLQAYSAFIQQADYANAAKCAVQTSALYHRENYYKEAFDVLRAAEQNILSANQQNAQALATLRFPITKERLRMYIKLKNAARAQDQLGQLEEQAKAAGSDSLTCSIRRPPTTTPSAKISRAMPLSTSWWLSTTTKRSTTR